MTIRPIAPNLATSHGAGRLTALAVVGGLGLLAAIRPSRAVIAPEPQPEPAPAPPACALPATEVVAPAPVAPERPAIHAADLVGIYRAGACTLTIDASGTYRDSCGDNERHPYAIHRDELVLLGGIAQRRPLVVFGTRLVDADGTTYEITGGAR